MTMSMPPRIVTTTTAAMTTTRTALVVLWTVVLLVLGGDIRPTGAVLLVDSFPNRCVAGAPAATGRAASDPIPTLAQKGYTVTIGGIPVTQTLVLAMGAKYEIAVQASAAPFEGALIRVDGAGLVEAGTNSGIAEACAALGLPGVAGVGHVDSAPKHMLSGYYSPTKGATSLTLDVTVVETNGRGGGGVYSYQRFTFPVVVPPSPLSIPSPGQTPRVLQKAPTAKAPTNKAPTAKDPTPSNPTPSNPMPLDWIQAFFDAVLGFLGCSLFG